MMGFSYRIVFFVVISSKECLSRSEGLALLTSQIADKYEWAATDKRQIREQFVHQVFAGFFVYL